MDKQTMHRIYSEISEDNTNQSGASRKDEFYYPNLYREDEGENLGKNKKSKPKKEWQSKTSSCW